MRHVALFALVACHTAVDITPVIDEPVDDPTAKLTSANLDQIEIEVAHEGSTTDLVGPVFFSKGQALTLDNVPLADDLVIHMTGIVGGQQPGFGRTCPFVATDGVSPHLFFSNQKVFGTLPFTPEVRLGGAGFTYHDGSGLLLAGTDASGQPIVDVERFEPQTGTYTQIGQIAARLNASVTSIQSGTLFQVVVIGGTDLTGEPSGFAELIEADSDPMTLKMVPDDRLAVTDMSVTPLSGGKLVMMGGIGKGGVVTPALYTLSFNGNLGIQISRGMLSVPRHGQTATRLGDDLGAAVIVAGGLDATGQPVALGELFKPLDDHFADPTTFRPMMNVPRSKHTAVRLPDGSVLILGGVDASGNAITTVERFAVDTGFVALPANTLPRNPQLLNGVAPTLDFATVPLPDGDILILGGRADQNSPPQASAFIVSLDTAHDTVVIVGTDPMAAPRLDPQATLLCDGTVLVSGGAGTGLPAERYNPVADGRR